MESTKSDSHTSLDCMAGAAAAAAGMDHCSYRNLVKDFDKDREKKNHGFFCNSKTQPVA